MPRSVAVIGGGPAGLIAAETLAAENMAVTVYERKPSVGRKFLMAGRGGLNLTHSEDIKIFLSRYGARAGLLEPLIRAFPPQALRAWCEELGEKTFVGSSGRVFPENFKASPLLRAWITRLEEHGVRLMLNHDWQGWDRDSLVFKTPEGIVKTKPDAVLLALGGASWPRLGSDGSWVDILKREGVKIAPLRPANCGFCVSWSEIFRQRFAGKPLKPVIASFEDMSIQGEIMIAEKGVEGGAIYALSSRLRDEIARVGAATFVLDLKPDLDLAAMAERLKKPRGGASFSNYLRKVLNLSDAVMGLILERPERQKLGDYPPAKLAQLIKAYPLRVTAPFAIDRAISTAGGVTFDSLDAHFMLLQKPGVFAAGEMLDWEAPTGGYLLQASFAIGIHAARGIVSWLK